MNQQKKEYAQDLENQLNLSHKQAAIYAKELAQTYKKEKTLSKMLKQKLKELDQSHQQSIIYAKELNEAYQAEKKYSNLLEEAYQKLKKSYLDTIFLLSVAAEYRDEDTGEHIKRMSHYSAAIAKTMDISEEAVETILYASPMHDLGKIGIPDQILFKPDKLIPEEFETMKTHTIIGGKILSGSDADLLKAAKVIALTHHERWDGNGYPNRLKGEEIPLMGRITSLADVFDALTSQRPYKPAFSNEKSFKIIREGLGTQFDPRVLEAFFSISEEILEIQERSRSD